MAKIRNMAVLRQLVNIINDRYGSKRGFLLSIRDVLLASLFRRSYFKTDLTEASRVVFVCQGNICRSALAEQVLKCFTDRPVASFGLDTFTGKPANERMLSAAESLGFNLSGHAATSIEDINISKGDLLVCMEYEQAKYIIDNKISNNVVVLGSFISKARSRLPDPYSASDKYMYQCAKLIILATTELSKRLDQL